MRCGSGSSTQVEEIVWRYKLAPATISLPATGVKEIQVFSIACRTAEMKEDVLRTLDRAIPSLLFFELSFQGRSIRGSYKRAKRGRPRQAVLQPIT